MHIGIGVDWDVFRLVLLKASNCEEIRDVQPLVLFSIIQAY